MNQSITFRGQTFSLKDLTLAHPEYGGNKWFKLKYNLERARHEGHDTILTFGGAWSNHIHATAAACSDLGFKSMGVIRGERPEKLSDTLVYAESKGMRLFFVSREEYREKHEPFFKAWLHDELGSFYLIPEGGSNYLGVQGCTEILTPEDANFENIYCACGTGATLAGIILSLKPNQRAIGVSALKGGFMTDEVMKHLTYALGDHATAEEYRQQFEVIDDAHFGGYAKTTPELMAFIREFRDETGIQLDPVYTGKMMWALMHGHTKEESTLTLAIHTGGLQGLMGIR